MEQLEIISDQAVHTLRLQTACDVIEARRSHLPIRKQTLNLLISSNGEFIDLSGENTRGYLNATLLQNPIFNQGFVSFPIDGSFVIPALMKSKKDQSESEAPDKDKDGKGSLLSKSQSQATISSKDGKALKAGEKAPSNS